MVISGRALARSTTRGVEAVDCSTVVSSEALPSWLGHGTIAAVLDSQPPKCRLQADQL